jgi:hypothetical protein
VLKREDFVIYDEVLTTVFGFFSLIFFCEFEHTSQTPVVSLRGVFLERPDTL